MIIFNKILTVSSENLYKIVEGFMVEYRCELARKTGHNLSETAVSHRIDFPAIYFNNVLGGWVRAYPLTIISSRVVIEAYKNDGEDAPEMNELRDYILEIVGRGLREQSAARILKEFDPCSDINNEMDVKYIESKESEEEVNQSNHSRIAPTRLADLDKWKAVWNYIETKHWLKMGMSPEKIREYLKKDQERHSFHGTVFSVDTIKEIIRSGREGELS